MATSVKTISMFETSDGKSWRYESDALKHQAKLDYKKKLKDCYLSDEAVEKIANLNIFYAENIASAIKEYIEERAVIDKMQFANRESRI